MFQKFAAPSAPEIGLFGWFSPKILVFLELKVTPPFRKSPPSIAALIVTYLHLEKYSNKHRFLTCKDTDRHSSHDHHLLHHKHHYSIPYQLSHDFTPSPRILNPRLIFNKSLAFLGPIETHGRKIRLRRLHMSVSVCVCERVQTDNHIITNKDKNVYR